MKKRILLLGSTGSIGRQTLDVVRANPDVFQVVGLAAGRSLNLLAEHAREFLPQAVACVSDCPESLFPPAVRLYTGDSAVVRLVEEIEADLVVIATPGYVGFAPALAALALGRTVALANKEVLVMAGELVTSTARRHGARILPIDSEHSAIWQCLQGEDSLKLRKLVLTASGGPFRELPLADLAHVTPQQALQHPVWQMGAKVTIDSATLLNKGLEVIEAHWLFGVPYDRIEVVVHPQGIVHSLVEFVDGSLKAQLGYPDMRLPIQYALAYPERLPTSWSGLDFRRVPRLDFQAPDLQRFPALGLAIAAGKTGGTAPAVLCAADEVAVNLFLQGDIKFPEIPQLIERALERHRPEALESLEQVLAVDAETRRTLLESVAL